MWFNEDKAMFVARMWNKKLQLQTDIRHNIDLFVPKTECLPNYGNDVS